MLFASITSHLNCYINIFITFMRKKLIVITKHINSCEFIVTTPKRTSDERGFLNGLRTCSDEAQEQL